MFILPKSMWKGKLTQFYLTIEIFSSALTTYLFTFKMEKYTPIYLEFYSKQINLFWRKLLHWNVYPENLCWLLNSEPRKQQQKDLFVSDALIEMVGDSSVDSSPWVPPDKYYNPGSHITLKCIIRQQLSKHTNLNSTKEEQESQSQQPLNWILMLNYLDWLADR